MTEVDQLLDRIRHKDQIIKWREEEIDKQDTTIARLREALEATPDKHADGCSIHKILCGYHCSCYQDKRRKALAAVEVTQ